MEFKVFLILSLFIGSSLGQSLSCRFTNFMVNGEPHYGCYLDIENPDGNDDFTTIPGEHTEGRTDADVTTLQPTFSSQTAVFPQILCRQFPNLINVDFSWMGVTSIDENTLSGCRNLEWLRFWINDISSVHENAFANNNRLQYIDFENNDIVELPENVFNGLSNLTALELTFNRIVSLPNGIFRSLTNLNTLLLANNNIEELNPQWFTTFSNLQLLSVAGNNISSFPSQPLTNLQNLEGLELSYNPLSQLPADAFRLMTNLRVLHIASIGLTEIDPQLFSTLNNLEILFIYSNSFTSIPQRVFDNLSSLVSIDIGNNHLTDTAIPEDLFDNLPQLRSIAASSNLIQTINPRWFRNTTDLESIVLNFNNIEELPVGVFASIRELRRIELWFNNIKTINRDSFGNIGRLEYVDFDNNVINAIDERFLREAEPLSTFYLFGNLCTGERFYSFASNRNVFLPRLALCSNNYRFIIDIETAQSDEYNFYEGQYPGLQLRVASDSVVNIALTAFDLPWNPMLEIIIGTGNNTLSQIIRNQNQTVVNIPTPNVLRIGQFTGFRVTWSNHVVLVTREGQTYPFLAYTMEDFYSVNFFGLRSPNSSARWSIQPVESEISPSEDGMSEML